MKGTEKEMIVLPKKQSWDAPEGTHAGFLSEVFTVTGKKEGSTRLVFTLTEPRHPRITYKVGKSYTQETVEALNADLESWIGADLDTLVGPNGELSLEALKSLIGRDAVLEVVRIRNPRHKNPFCHVKSIVPVEASVCA